ncbi:hypothetical protein MKX01_001085 [Papaver californicum]|nr:hypothetical protein MKX01_001085 [Papaver californicum]
MASSNGIIVFLVILQSSLTAADLNLSPLLSPFLEDVCKEIGCGKGKCKASSISSSTNDLLHPFKCECEPGWKQTLGNNTDHDFLQFLPCVIPNCTMDYSCNSVADSPMPEIREPPSNESLFDPCNWAYCGEGSCIKSNTFGHKCKCKEGYENLLNVTAFPCLRECAIGMDCLKLGIAVPNRTTNSTPNMPDRSENHANTILQGKFLSLVIFVVTIVMVPWK